MGGAGGAAVLDTTAGAGTAVLATAAGAAVLVRAAGAAVLLGAAGGGGGAAVGRTTDGGGGGAQLGLVTLTGEDLDRDTVLCGDAGAAYLEGVGALSSSVREVSSVSVLVMDFFLFSVGVLHFCGGGFRELEYVE